MSGLLYINCRGGNVTYALVKTCRIIQFFKRMNLMVYKLHNKKVSGENVCF